MERRGFLQMLGFGLTPLAISSIPSGSPYPNSSRLLDEFNRGPWVISWSGWIRPSNMHILSGYWVANRKDSYLGAYSGVPGACNWFYPMQMFDTSIYEDEGQILITPETPLLISEKQKQLALNRLIKFLDDDKQTRYYHI